MQLLVLVPRVTNRLLYVLDYVLVQQAGLNYTITADATFYNQQQQPRIAYMPTVSITQGLCLYGVDTLFETGITAQELRAGSLNGLPVLFVHDKPQSALPFDVFAAIFYLLSRYEEYVYTGKDAFGNFDYKQSFAWQQGALQIPLVDAWTSLLLAQLQQHYPQLQLRKQQPHSLLTFDIDVAFAYTHKNFFRTAGSLLQKLAAGNWKKLKHQCLALLGMIPDPFDTYGYIQQQVKQQRCIFFINMGTHGPYDKNPSYRNGAFKQLIRWLGAKHEAALHPSYASNANPALVKKEKDRLEGILGRSIRCSRQHYLKLSLPATCRTLIQAGIQKDFTMGYYFEPGFRAGTCKPFLFYDLVADRASNLELVPFSCMDGTLKDALQLSHEEAKAVITQLLDTIAAHNGVFVSLWHNSTLSEQEGWQGWRSVFEHTLESLALKGFRQYEQRFEQ